MWIEQRGDKYLAVDRYKDFMTGKWKRVSTVMDRDTAHARNKAQKILQARIEALRQQDPEPQDISLAELKEEYLKYQTKLLKESTVIRNEIVLNVVVRAIGPDTLCSRLTAGIIMSRLIDTGKENVTINSYLTRLKAMLRWGYQNDYCPDIAGKLKMLPDRSEREKIQDKFLEKEDLKKLLDGMQVEYWQNLSRLLALSGLRIGEALALTYTDLDTDQRLIHVTKTLSRASRKVTSPKTADSVRDVYMQDELLSLCRRLVTGAKERALAHGYTSDLIFCNLDGEHINYDVYEKYLRENSERILGRRITSHVMRHTMTSLFAEAGVDLSVISRRLGHHDSRLTRDIYLHCTQAQREKDHEAVRKVSLIS